MADWRHIQGKIRKARTSSDPPGQLAALYESTRDAMVAFELARLHEKNGSNADAATWYLTAAEKFRRAQWKTKAQEALVRLGVEVPLAITEASALASESVSPEQVQGEVMREISGTDKLFGRTEASSQYAEGTGEPDADADEGMDAPGESEGAGDIATSAVVEGASADGVAGDAAKKRRRRGRRGGRGRRKKVVGAPVSAVTAAAIPAESAADFVEPVDARTVDAQPVAAAMIPARAIPSRPSQQTGGRGSGRVSSQGRRGSSSSAPVARRDAERVAEPIVASEAEFADTSSGSIGPAAWQGRRRAGEPALASRLAGLESRLRRMLASPPSSLDDADKAPAGPGVFVLSDSELHDNYYVEACQTLRIGIGNLVRSGRTRNGDNIRGLLADHLGITEPKVAKYLKDHCAIRWVQLDEEAQLLAHFAIAMLRPALND
ncbi:MAG TPA: hypothetical protein VIH72_14775 [Candidatus Acidoferrales bacterium]